MWILVTVSCFWSHPVFELSSEDHTISFLFELYEKIVQPQCEFLHLYFLQQNHKLGFYITCNFLHWYLLMNLTWKQYQIHYLSWYNFRQHTSRIKCHCDSRRFIAGEVQIFARCWWFCWGFCCRHGTRAWWHSCWWKHCGCCEVSKRRPINSFQDFKKVPLQWTWTPTHMYVRYISFHP